jgi:CRP-like cAMP-binding protein
MAFFQRANFSSSGPVRVSSQPPTETASAPAVRFELFADVPDAVVAETLCKLPCQAFAEGEIVMHENAPNDRVFLIEEGELEVWKGRPNASDRLCIARLKAGDCFGEMSAITSEPSTATVVARTPGTARILALADLPADHGLREIVTLNLARTLVHRLSKNNEAMLAKHEREMRATRVVAAASAFITRMLTALTCYMFSLPLVAFVTPMLPSDSLVSFLFIVIFSWVVVNFMHQWPEARTRDWHMTLVRWPRQIARGLLWTIPPLLVFLVVKLSVMYARPGQYAFFEPMTAIDRNAPMNLPLWLTFAFVYAALVFVQEFIRCAIQGTLGMITTASQRGGPWKAILVSNVVFASIHLHLGPAFTAQAFIAGLFFGYEFHRERSYLSVAVSHAVVGLWAVFIVGIPA